MELVRQGAEAKIFRVDFVGRAALVKERFSKAYRHPEMDKKLRIRRTLAEVRAIQRCRKLGVDSPVMYHVDYQRCRIVMEKIDGETVRDSLFALEEKNDSEEAIVLMKRLGETIANMHNGGLIHGDLTTSNFIVRRSSGSIVVIDFGLSYTSRMIEDCAVDLYVLERAFLSTHPKSEKLFEKVLNAYHGCARIASKVLSKLEDVRRRGRKRDMLG
ncbi:hypothetical protein AAMO2058_000431400 [Amorphochlora amoebiformis]|uniref:non-specific serine/threonine protein kinase n=1 Tax=Amorphochlora amoebiformis TaxID=1561963 RepID=A0A7S0DPR9_9EUKA|mmetsp:Transcript_485/g.706  ORF Transcript_485/g.706 Transcript_485/m.706 type:complete len:215 (+) Transcript_485:76-720(+)